MNEITWRTSMGDTVTVFRTVDGQFAWHVQAANGEVVGQGESHPHRADAIAAAERHHPRIEEP